MQQSKRIQYQTFEMKENKKKRYRFLPYRLQIKVNGIPKIQVACTWTCKCFTLTNWQRWSDGTTTRTRLNYPLVMRSSSKSILALISASVQSEIQNERHEELNKTYKSEDNTRSICCIDSKCIYAITLTSSKANTSTYNKVQTTITICRVLVLFQKQQANSDSHGFRWSSELQS
jgi:hypothetical protein